MYMTKHMYVAEHMYVAKTMYMAEPMYVSILGRNSRRSITDIYVTSITMIM